MTVVLHVKVHFDDAAVHNSDNGVVAVGENTVTRMRRNHLAFNIKRSFLAAATHT